MTRTEPGRIHHVADRSGSMSSQARRLGFPVFPAGAYAQERRLRGRVVESRCRVGDAEGGVRDLTEAGQCTGAIVRTTGITTAGITTAGIIKTGIIKTGIIKTGIM
jgi:hypothetical protein